MSTSMEIHKPINFSHLTFVLFFLLSSSLFEIHGSNTTDSQAYIVHVQMPKHTKFLSIREKKNWYMSFLPNTTSKSGEPRMVYAYQHAISGFVANLTPEELQATKSKPGVLSVYPEHECELQTTYSPKFLGLSRSNGLWPDSGYGRGIIIGMIDSGIKFDHPSFDDKNMPPPPQPPIWNGKCYFSRGGCNKKIIGAIGFRNGWRVSPFDTDGHGTHTASTAAGTFVEAPEGMASGLAPKAHIAVYKVSPGTSKDVLKGIDRAIHDHVDVLSISIGINPPPRIYEDNIAIGSFAAVTKGILPVQSAGNGGPLPSIVDMAPWILTVGSSVTDRRIRAKVKLGDGREFNGESAYQPDNFAPTQFPLIYPHHILKTEDSRTCKGSLNSIDIKGKIVLCEGSPVYTGNLEAGDNIRNAGGAGIIIMSQRWQGNQTNADAHLLPASHVTFDDANEIKHYLVQTSNPTAAIEFNGTQFGDQPAPVVSFTSGRGPNFFSRNIIKPDVIAPGSNILAAWPTEVGPNRTGKNNTFRYATGTSMAAPHVSGIVALLKYHHRHWSPAAIKSAIMTTAYTKDRDGNPIKDQFNGLNAGAFAMGSGHVDPVAANEPGLVYDIDPHDYIRYLCGMKLSNKRVSTIVRDSVTCSKIQAIDAEQLNYPSISVSLEAKSMTKIVNRTVTNVGDADSVYTVKLDNPVGVNVNVYPNTLRFTQEGEKQDFAVILSAEGVAPWPARKISEGQMLWNSGKYLVRSPIVVMFA